MRLLDRVTTLNLAMVMAHQADAAYWKEWEMFGLPGGIQLFDLFNVVIFLVLLGCFASVVARGPSGFRGSLVIAALSGIALPIHAGFAVAGFTQFHLPVSMALIIGTFVVSLWQVVLTLRERREFNGESYNSSKQVPLRGTANLKR